ncbi:MAG: XdhC family protein [Synergistaceae bacterium]|jgi:xanthine dehydrogenase accessory factor|nr:XdhC family protein [Synergistaceae bacterium]
MEFSSEYGRATRKLYRDLIQALNGGREMVLVTSWDDAGVSKALHFAAEGMAEETKDAASIQKNDKDGKLVVTEYFAPKSRLIVFGGGHIAVPLSQMAFLLKFDVVIFDDRPAFANRSRFPMAKAVLCDRFETVGESLTIGGNDYVVIATRGHRHDQECLRGVLSGCFPRYVGMVGSRRRVAVMRRQMTEEGFSPDLLDRLRAPVGLSIGAVTPEEIALSILAEIVRDKRQGPDAGQNRLCSDTEPIEWLACPENDDKKAALVTVLSTKGSTPREAGAKMVALADGVAVGSIGGGCAEADVARDARDILQNGGCLLKTVDMTDIAEDDGMMCGGTMEVLIEAL